MKERVIMSIDLKSFFASCECVNRGLDPFTTPLVVADTSRGKGAMTLAVTPYLRSKGVQFKIKDILLLDTFFNPIQKYFIKYMVFTPKEKIIKRLIN